MAWRAWLARRTYSCSTGSGSGTEATAGHTFEILLRERLPRQVGAELIQNEVKAQQFKLRCSAARYGKHLIACAAETNCDHACSCATVASHTRLHWNSAIMPKVKGLCHATATCSAQCTMVLAVQLGTCPAVEGAH